MSKKESDEVTNPIFENVDKDFLELEKKYNRRFAKKIPKDKIPEGVTLNMLKLGIIICIKTGEEDIIGALKNNDLMSHMIKSDNENEKSKNN